MEPTMDDLTNDELEHRLCELSAHIAAAEYRWLRLLAEFDRRRGWAAWGIKSCAHWLNWKCGLDLRSARDKVRVAHALDDLPVICQAFSRGELSYSKVRAITRIATPQTEAELVMFARHGTTQHVEKIVRGYRRSVPVDDAQAAYDKRHLTWRYRDDGTIDLRARVPAEVGELVITAVQMLVEEISRTHRTPDGASDGSAEPPRDRADALVEMARRILAGEKHSASSGDRYMVNVHVDADALAGEDGSCHLENGPALCAEAVKRLTCDGSLVAVVEGANGQPLNVGRKTRTIPTATRRALLARDKGCQFPGCTHRAFVDGHHIRHWSQGGETALANLVLLCPFHHRLLHEGGIDMRVEHDGRFTFLRKDGRIIETAALSVEPRGVEERNGELEIAIDSHTIVPRWWGDGCDYSVAIEGLARRNGVAYGMVGNGSAEPPSAEPSGDEAMLGVG